MAGFLIQPNGQPGQNSDDRSDLARRFAMSMLGHPAQNANEGWGQLAAGIGLGLSKYQEQGKAFPAAPGGGQPSFMTGLANFFTGRNNGGLY